MLKFCAIFTIALQRQVIVLIFTMMAWCSLTSQSENAWGASGTRVCGDSVKTVLPLKPRNGPLVGTDDGHQIKAGDFMLFQVKGGAAAPP